MDSLSKHHGVAQTPCEQGAGARGRSKGKRKGKGQGQEERDQPPLEPNPQGGVEVSTHKGGVRFSSRRPGAARSDRVKGAQARKPQRTSTNRPLDAV
ncbi:hypothetical protein GCM10010470_25720 [Saccharopolyspora taberi]|uniref:Uncharacterized protein n=1 Tax=Saccharopolyspora taberi TaxID=60895 RepID=A0ABN3VBS6_9PSEU